MNYPSDWPCMCGLNKKWHEDRLLVFEPVDNLTYVERLANKGIPESGEIRKSYIHVGYHDVRSDYRGIE